MRSPVGLSESVRVLSTIAIAIRMYQYRIVEMKAVGHFVLFLTRVKKGE